MKIETRLAPPNSMVLIMDQSVGEVPESMNGESVAATSSCVAVGTLSQHDSETSITISDERPMPDSGLSAVFNEKLNTPNKRLSVCSVEDVALIGTDVSSAITLVDRQAYFAG